MARVQTAPGVWAEVSRAVRTENPVFSLSSSSFRNGDVVTVNLVPTSAYVLASVSAVFEGQNRVARQRLVYDALKDEFAGGLHALNVKAMTPSEAGS